VLTVSHYLGLDPGLTTGWCLYDATTRRIVDWGEFMGYHLDGIALLEPRSSLPLGTIIVLEKPVAQGPTRPQVVETAYVAGRLFQWCADRWPDVREMPRWLVRRQLQHAVYGSFRVTDDKTVWQALVVLHGEGCDARPRRRKGQIVDPGGTLGRVTGHGRAALAVAVAQHLANLEGKDAAASPDAAGG
jgi:hypothetical protein